MPAHMLPRRSFKRTDSQENLAGPLSPPGATGAAALSSICTQTLLPLRWKPPVDERLRRLRKTRRKRLGGERRGDERRSEEERGATRS